MHSYTACILKEWHICIQFLVSDNTTLICISVRKVGYALLDEKGANIIVVQSNQETISFQQQIFQPTCFPPFNYLKNAE